MVGGSSVVAIEAVFYNAIIDSKGGCMGHGADFGA
jgi:hypothetical protein